MNKILQLFDEKYVTDLFTEKVLPLYPDFTRIKKIKIIAYKNQIWEHTYHVVIEFRTKFITTGGKIKTLPIFCTAHSSEPRENVYDGLKYLWENNFARGYMTIPHPLFYSDYFRGTFYRGVSGHNLYHYIRNNNTAEIEAIIPKIAAWFVKLHRMPVAATRNFNPQNSRIKSVLPGIENILERINDRFPGHHADFKKIYEIVINEEDNFLDNTERRWLVHGDAHPENVIKMGRKKVAFIDFADLCLSDFARDLGSFTQQLDYMINRKINDPLYADKIKKLFLDNYVKNAKIKLDDALEKRIATYYIWTSLRTSTFFLLKDKIEQERSLALLNKIKSDLKL